MAPITSITDYSNGKKLTISQKYNQMVKERPDYFFIKVGKSKITIF